MAAAAPAFADVNLEELEAIEPAAEASWRAPELAAEADAVAEQASLDVEADSTLAQYFRDIRREPLLTVEEERELGRLVRAGLAAARRLAASKGDAAERAELERRMQAGRRAKEKLVLANLRLVVSVAYKYANRGVPLLDLIQEGNIGLAHAVDKFDSEKGYRLTTYAYWWIRQSIARALANQARTIRLPVHTVAELGRLLQARTQLHQRLGREPSDGELARELGSTVARVRWLRRTGLPPVSLEKPIGPEGEDLLGQFIEDRTAPTPGEEAERGLVRREIRDVLDALTERERLVLSLRYGLDDGAPRTLEEVSRRIGLTRERARQIEAEALRKLRGPQFRDRLQSLLDPQPTPAG
jgi:RNA polymerase primary sigma factor